MLVRGETLHTVQTGETLAGITAHYLDDCFGRPKSHKEFAERAKLVEAELAAIVERNHLPNSNFLDSGSRDPSGKQLEPAQVLIIPDAHNLYTTKR
jgi:hypothetical protein